MYKFSVGFHLISHRPSNDTLFALDTKNLAPKLWHEYRLQPFAILFTARCTLVQSAVLRSHVVCLSVCPSVCNVCGL